MGGTLTAGSMSSGPGESGPSFTLQADEINLVGGAGTVQAPGRLLIQTASDGQPILLGGARDSSPSVLDLTAGDIEALANGFRDIVIGGALTTGTATISLAGNVDFADPVTLRTNGPITLTSGSLNGTDNASLTLDAGAGITAGELGTDGNDITLVGDRDGDGTGSVNLAGPVTTNGGAITISGAASIGAGVALLTTGSLNSGGGDITVNGTTTGSTSDAIGTHVGGAISSQGGNITLTGRGPNGGIFVTTASILDAGTGNLVLNADDPRIVGQVRGLGALQIAPLTTTLPILLGGTGDIGTTFLNAAEIARLGDGFSQRTIGQPGHAGTMTLDNFTLSSPLAVNGTTILGPNQDTTWAAQADGSVLAGGFGSSLRLLNPTTITGGSATNTVQGTTSSDTITPTAANTLQLGTVQFRNISIFDGLGGFDTVRGSAANDTVNEVGTNAISIPLSGIRFNNIEAFDGLAGINTVIGSGRTNTVTSLGTNAISLNGMQFSNINSFDGLAGPYTLLGTAGNDTVSVLSSVALQSNNIEFRGIRAFDGQGGTNTLLGTERDDFVTTTGPNALTLNGFRFLNISTFDGGIGTDTVVGTAGNDTVNDVGPNAIRLSGIRFNNIEAFDGLAGINTVIGSGRTNTVTSLAPNSLALNGVNFSNINSFDGLAGPYTLLGTAGNDTVSVLRSVALQANNVEFRGITAFDGQGGTNTLLGTAGNDTFTLGGGNVLQFGGFTFRNLQGLDGGSGVNTLVGTAGDDTFFLQSANGGFVQWLPFPALSFTNINAINTLTGQDSIALTGVPLDVPITHGGGTLILSNSTGGDIVLNANVQTPGNLVIGSSAGNIVQTGGQVVARGTTSLEADGGITLAGANDFNGVTVPRSQSLTLVDINDLVLGDLFFTQGLDIRAVGNLTATRNLIQGAASSSPPLSLSSSRLTPGLPVGVTLTSGATLTTRDITVSGGPITLQANGPLTSGNLNTSGSVGGAVSLQSGDRIQVNTINAQGSSVGGRITATAATTFQVLGSFLDRNGIAASLSTVGGTQGGPMTLTYNTSLFTIGDASLNGTQAAITSGNVALKPGDFVFGSRVFGSGLPGQVSFIAPGSPPPPPPPSPPSDAVPEVILDDREERLAVDDRTGDGDEIPVRLTSTGGAVEDNEFQDIEADIASEFSGYFSGTFQPPRPVSLTDAQNTLRDIQALTGEVPALVYVRFNRQARGDGLELLLVSPHGDPLRVQVLSANPQAVIRAQELLRRQLTNPNLTNNRDYLVPAQQLYDWIIAPIRSELEAAGITNLSFIMDGGLRTLPLAALHDGERFLIESYSVGLVPSLGLIDPTYVDLNRQTSTMTIGGASQFLNQSPLLAARTEIEAIRSFWPSNTLAEANFTVAALQQTRQQAQIVHLATHAEFLRGAPDQSYIQFSDGRLSLDNMAQLRWFDPTVDLVTLSACQTAMGNAQAELGFAGFALQAGARSALASLWRVSDEATAGLMTTFYQQLDQQATKSEALRQAQLAFIRGEATIENGQIRWPGGTLPLPPALVFSGTQDLSHPFYWAAFTIVGSPW
jgi:CHAT domain-containing protein